MSDEKKFGRLTPENFGHAMPAHNPAYIKGPWYYRDTEVVMITYLTDEDKALDLLPSDLELVQPAMAFMVIEFNHFTTSGGPYGEVYTGVLCMHEGQMYGYTNGVYVTTENALLPGREIWGFGKKMAHNISVKQLGTGEIEAKVEVHEGTTNVHCLMKPEVNQPAAILEDMPLAVLKVIPGVDGQSPDVLQLNSVLFKGVPHKGADGKDELYTGSATLEVDNVSDVSLPVIQVVDAKYMRMTADLPYGETIKDYLA